MNVIKSDIARIKDFMKPPAEAAYIKPANSVVDEVVKSITDPSVSQAGVPLHYLDHYDHMRFRLGELSIWSGINSHGKSLILNQFILHAAYEVKALIISPEMPLHQTMKRMTFQATRQRHPLEHEIRQFHAWTEDKIWLYDQCGTIDPKIIIAVIRYAVATHGVQHIVIDSLMKCGLNESKDMDGVKRFIDQLCTVAKDLHIHIHMVAHSRKGENDNQVPDKSSIKGTGAISDLADNVLIQWRNEKKEEALRKLNLSFSERQEIETKPDGILLIKKQRHGDFTGNIRLWLDMPSLLFMDKPNIKPVKANYGELKTQHRVINHD